MACQCVGHFVANYNRAWCLKSDPNGRRRRGRTHGFGWLGRTLLCSTPCCSPMKLPHCAHAATRNRAKNTSLAPLLSFRAENNKTSLWVAVAQKEQNTMQNVLFSSFCSTHCVRQRKITRRRGCISDESTYCTCRH